MKLSNNVKVGNVYITKDGRKATVLKKYYAVFTCHVENTIPEYWTYNYFGACFDSTTDERVEEFDIKVN